MSPRLRRPASSSHLALCASLVGACSAPPPAASPDPRPDAAVDGADAQTTFACSENDALDLDGIFAVYATLSLTFGSHPGGAVTVCPVDQTSEGAFLAVLGMHHAEGSTNIDSMQAFVCSLELPQITAMVGECDPSAANLVRAGLVFPQALIESFPTTPLATTSAQLASLSLGAAVTPGRMTFIIGTRETGDQMPTWDSQRVGCGVLDTSVGRGPQCEAKCVTDCARLYDDDKDGWPAATVDVCGTMDQDKDATCHFEDPSIAGVTIQGRAMLNLQVDPVLAGQASSSCEIVGTLDTQIRYNVVGADLYLEGTPISVTSATASLPVYKVNTHLSRFRGVRIDGRHGSRDWKPDFSDRGATCHQLIAHQNEIK